VLTEIVRELQPHRRRTIQTDSAPFMMSFISFGVTRDKRRTLPSWSNVLAVVTVNISDPEQPTSKQDWTTTRKPEPGATASAHEVSEIGSDRNPVSEIVVARD
jgi:hypothetical protein